MGRFADHAACACANRSAFQHAFPCCRSDSRTHYRANSAALTRRFSFVAFFKHCARACANHSAANSAFNALAGNRARRGAQHRASSCFIDSLRLTSQRQTENEHSSDFLLHDFSLTNQVTAGAKDITAKKPPF
jgi:hypothetical protein